MKRIVSASAIVLATTCALLGAEPAEKVSEVANTKGLVAFWDFSLMQDGRWTSYHDENVVNRGFPVSDPVAQDVFQYKEPVASNPFHYPWPIFSPRSFVLKFNGYNAGSSGVYEHWLHVDTEAGTVTYDRSCPASAAVQRDYRLQFDGTRDGKSLMT